jgi:hypothetical protein
MGWQDADTDREDQVFFFLRPTITILQPHFVPMILPFDFNLGFDSCFQNL